MLYRRCKSGSKTDAQSLPLILFLDVASRCSVRAIYSCHMFCHNRLPSGTWLLPWHLMSASADYSNQRSSQYSLLRSPHPPPFLTLSPPPPPLFLVFVMLSLSLRGHTVTLFTGSHAGVRCVCLH